MVRFHRALWTSHRAKQRRRSGISCSGRTIKGRNPPRPKPSPYNGKSLFHLMAPTANNALHRSAENQAKGEQRIRSERKERKESIEEFPCCNQVASGNSKQAFFLFLFWCLTLEGLCSIFFTGAVQVLVFKKRESEQNPDSNLQVWRKHAGVGSKQAWHSQGIPPSSSL